MAPTRSPVNQFDMKAHTRFSIVFVDSIRLTHNLTAHLLISPQNSLLNCACARMKGRVKRNANDERERELKLTTIEQAFARVPGYTGFLPESYANPRVISQATDHTSADQKNCRLFTLHQLRSFMPGTAIFEPRDATNLMEGPKGRAGTTTAFNVSARQDLCSACLRSRLVSDSHSRMCAAYGSGHVQNAYMSSADNLALLAHNRSLEKFYGSKNGTASFFQPGTLAVSENGVKNAEGFYRLLRPLEGLPRVHYPSETADSG